jgi:hypothetical protein
MKYLKFWSLMLQWNLIACCIISDCKLRDMLDFENWIKREGNISKNRYQQA